METQKSSQKSVIITDKKDKLSAIQRPEIQQVIWQRPLPFQLHDYISDTPLDKWKPFTIQFGQSDLNDGFNIEANLPHDLDEERAGEKQLSLEVLALCFSFIKFVKAKNYQLELITLGDGGEKFEIPENQLTMYCTLNGETAQWVSSKDLLIDGPRSNVTKQFIKDNAAVPKLNLFDVLLIKGNQNGQFSKNYLRIPPASTLSFRIKTLKLEH